MKQILKIKTLLILTGLLLINSPVLTAPKFPALTGRIVDQAGIISGEDRSRLESALSGHESKSGNQVVVAIINTLDGYDISDYGFQLGRHWGIGQKGSNNGALLIIAMAERKIRIEVGYGLEGVLTDAASKLIIEDIITPYFKSRNYSAGVLNGTLAIVNVLEKNALTEGVVKPQKRSRKKSPNWIVIIIIILIIYFVTKRGDFTGGGRHGGYYGGGGYFGGGGGFSGGGGGFSGGGGSFGGGGASGSW